MQIVLACIEDAVILQNRIIIMNGKAGRKSCIMCHHGMFTEAIQSNNNIYNIQYILSM